MEPRKHASAAIVWQDNSHTYVVLQAWLALSNLLSEPATLGRYTLDGPRSAALQRLRRLLNEVNRFIYTLHAHASRRKTIIGTLSCSTA